MRILTVAEMRAFDRRAIDELGLPAVVLMENAAIGVADALADAFPDARRVALLCGPGNNGGDGLAVARQLLARGYQVDPWVACYEAAPSAEHRLQRQVLERLGAPVADVEAPPAAGDSFDSSLAAADLVVDALFGAGLRRPLSGVWAELVGRAAAARRPILAVDLPSGVDGDRCQPIGPALAADLTVALGALKPAHALTPVCALAGEVVVADLGVPPPIDGGPGALHLLVDSELATWLAPRAAGAHKGQFGHVLLVAGGRGRFGAAVLAARAAVVGGAGLVTVAVPESGVGALTAACPEAMTIPLAEGEDGASSGEAIEQLAAGAAGRVLAVGPGLGRSDAMLAAVRRLTLASSAPLVLDADGLGAFEGRLADLTERRGPTVLTPHPGELARLLGVSTAEIGADRLAAARTAAERSGCLVVLKGERTLIAAPDGEAWVNTTGNPGMASGGSGDALTGLLAARLAQGDEPVVAAGLSVHLHGAAGDLAAAGRGGAAVPAGALIEQLAAAHGALARA